MRSVIFLLLIAFQTVFSTLTFAGDTLKIVPISQDLNLDGKVSEAVWEQCEKISLKMHFPEFGIQPTEQSDIRITYDKDYLWIGAKLYYQDISKMVSKSKKRDEASTNSDFFGIILDTYDDNENALAFFTMPSGLKIDYSVSNDALGDDDENANYTWNSYWDVMTSKDEKAWYVEMRIPFSSLRFQTVEKITKMGLIVNRGINYCNEIDTYPAIDTKYGPNGRMKPSQAMTVIFSNVKPHNPVYISPYLLTGFNREWLQVGNQYVKHDEPRFTGGLDIKYNINSNLTLDLTANTDFAQVEADDEQINLTRYSLFFPEKRLFFQERAGIFSYSLGGPQELFYSRNIGISNGDRVNIPGGARVVGRAGKWDIGFLDMVTASNNENPGENFGVARLRRQVINENSYVGGIVTSRIDVNGNYNYAYGIDGIFRIFKDDYLDVKLARTQDNDIKSELFTPDPAFFRLSWEKRSEEGFGYNAVYAWWGKDFNPESGFMFLNDLHEIRASTQYGWFPGNNSKIFNYSTGVDFEMLKRASDGKLENMEVSPELKISTKKGYNLSAGLSIKEEGLAEDFILSDGVFVPAGEYRFYDFKGEFGTPKTKKTSATMEIEAGEFFDGNRFSASINPEINLSASIQLSGSYQFDKVRFTQWSQELTNNIARIKLTYMFNTKVSLSSFVQYNEIDNILITNMRLRYNPRDGNDFYFVFNDLRNINSTEIGVSPPPFTNRIIILKYTHTFRL